MLVAPAALPVREGRGCSCMHAAVVEVLQQGSPGMLRTMTDPHSHASGHDHGHEHDHHPEPGLAARLRHLLRPHSHEPADQVDAVMEASAEGIGTLWISLGVLGVTALIQAVVVAVSGSVALLGDTMHNAADALTALPLGVAFVAVRRPPTRRYTYGYGRAEDLAGIAIVLTIAASSALAAYAAISRLMHPRHVSDLIVVAAAADPGVMQDLPHRGGSDRVAEFHELPDRGCRGRPSGTPRAGVVPFARDQAPAGQGPDGQEPPAAPAGRPVSPGQGGRAADVRDRHHSARAP
jgi:hypothetical protein